MEEKIKIWDLFWLNLVELLTEKILKVDKNFKKEIFYDFVRNDYKDKTLTGRTELIADWLKKSLGDDYKKNIWILVQIMWPENQKETWMFKEFYWLWPIWKYIEKYWLEDFEVSIKAIEELTKRNTWEFAIRPFLHKYPEKTLKIMKTWAFSDNFHLRRLASEWLRPKLPWAKKMDIFLENEAPVFEILDILKDDKIKFVMKSVWNNLADYLKLEKEKTLKFLDSWEKDATDSRKWIIKHAKRKLK